MNHHLELCNGDELRIRFTTWIQVVIRRAKIDYIRQNRTRMETVSFGEISEFDLLFCENDFRTTVELSDGEFNFDETRIAVAFSKLSVIKRKILIMLFVNDMPADKIASKLNCTLQHVYNQRSLALKELRCVLKKGGDDL